MLALLAWAGGPDASPCSVPPVLRKFWLRRTQLGEWGVAEQAMKELGAEAVAALARQSEAAHQAVQDSAASASR